LIAGVLQGYLTDKGRFNVKPQDAVTNKGTWPGLPGWEYQQNFRLPCGKACTPFCLSTP